MIENAVRLEARDGPGTVTIFSELWVPPPQTHTRTRQPPPGSPEYCEYPRPLRILHHAPLTDMGTALLPPALSALNGIKAAGRRWSVVLRSAQRVNKTRRTVAAT